MTIECYNSSLHGKADVAKLPHGSRARRWFRNGVQL
jgi:hypothetical protein